MTDVSTHFGWCGESCPAASVREDAEHRTDPAYASHGGPLHDSESDYLTDRVPTVAVAQHEECLAEIVMRPELLLRLSLGGTWGTPGDLLHLLPEIRMSETRARHLAQLLTEHADRARAINDGAAQ